MTNFQIFWIAIGIILTTATQLRIGSLPIGIGEILLVIWILWEFIHLLIIKQHLITLISKMVYLFWTVALTSLTLGLSIAESINLKSSVWYRDYFAFGFSFILSLCLTHSKLFYSQIHKMIDYVISCSMIALLIIFLFPSSMPFLTSWYGGVRFIAWCNNPNQLALLLSVIPFFGLFFFRETSNVFLKLKFLFLVIASLVLGIFTQSDALMLAWKIGLFPIIFLVIYLFIAKNISSRKYIKSGIKGIIQAIIVVWLALILLRLAEFSYQELYSDISDVYNKGDQGSDRMTLWVNGIAAIFSSPLFGLGPGAHSGHTRPFLNFEAHNTFIDWGSSSGIVGIIAYISLLGWVAWQSLKRQSFIMFAAVISLTIFSCFHYVLRHPIFWFYLLSIHSLNSQTSKTRY